MDLENQMNFSPKSKQTIVNPMHTTEQRSTTPRAVGVSRQFAADVLPAELRDLARRNAGADRRPHAATWRTNAAWPSGSTHFA